MVFAGAALVSTAACGGKNKSAETFPEDEQQERRGGGCVDPDEKRIAELEAQRDAAQTPEERAAIEQELENARKPMCMPYGAPPARRRVV